jgi:hypothetical protein
VGVWRRDKSIVSGHSIEQLNGPADIFDLRVWIVRVNYLKDSAVEKFLNVYSRVEVFSSVNQGSDGIFDVFLLRYIILGNSQNAFKCVAISKIPLDYVQSSAAVSRRSVQGFVVAAARNSRGRIERRL